MTKEEMVSRLVDFSLAAAAANPRDNWLRDIFTNGFRGFAAMSSAELLRELQFRGLAEFDDSHNEEDPEEDEEIHFDTPVRRNRPRCNEETGQD